VNILDTIGNTPLLKLNSISQAEVYAKAEFFNPGGSIKDRVAKNMIETAQKVGKVDANTTIIEPTSGNTGIGLALVCAIKNLKLILTMPESMSIERIKLLLAYGAKIELTPAAMGMKGAIEKAKSLNQSIKNSIILNQFENMANPDIHRKTTAIEILKDMKHIDIFVTGVGTGGTITGIGEVLKKQFPEIKIVAVEPKNSAVLNHKRAGVHKIQGIGAGFVPKILNLDIIDEIITISDEEAFENARMLPKQEGILVGISSGANIAATKLLAKNNPSKTILTILPDSGERYLSTELYHA